MLAVHKSYLFLSHVATLLSHQAVQLGLTTENHVWIIPGWYAQGWWTNAENDTNGNCTSEQVD